MPDPSQKPKPPNDVLADPHPANPAEEIDVQHLPALADEQDFLRLETTEEELARIERMLTRAEGFTLAFARVNAPTQRAKLVKAIQARVQQKGVEIVEMDLEGAVGDVLTEIKDFLQQHDGAAPDATAKRAVFVYGLERVIPSSAIYHPALALINLKRENFREAIPSPLLFWIPEYALQAIAEGAPDFWAWRSGVYEFTLPQEHTDALWSSVAPEGGDIALSRLPLDEKKERIRSLSGLLAEYEGREDKDEPNILAIRFDLLTRIGILYQYIGENEHALYFFQQALALAETSQDKTLLAQSYHSIGIIYERRAEYNQALEYYERTIQTLEALGNRGGSAVPLHQIGNLHLFRGSYDEALEYYKHSLKISEEIGNRSGIALSLHHIGIIYEKRGSYDQALEYYERSLKISEEIGNRSGIAASHGQLGQLFFELGQYIDAFEHSLTALSIFAELQSPYAAQAANDLKRLRSTWDAEPFDAAWQEATGEAVPDDLKESDATDAEDA